MVKNMLLSAKLFLIIIAPLIVLTALMVGFNNQSPTLTTGQPHQALPFLTTTLTTTVMYEDFEGEWPPANGLWVADGNPTWGVTTYTAYSEQTSLWVASGGSKGLDPATSNYPIQCRPGSLTARSL